MCGISEFELFEQPFGWSVLRGLFELVQQSASLAEERRLPQLEGFFVDEAIEQRVGERRQAMLDEPDRALDARGLRRGARHSVATGFLHKVPHVPQVLVGEGDEGKERAQLVDGLALSEGHPATCRRMATVVGVALLDFAGQRAAARIAAKQATKRKVMLDDPRVRSAV